MSDSITQTANSLMRAVANTGCIRSADQDAEVAVRVMREELKSFLTLDDAKYADERALVQGAGPTGLAFASLVAECAKRILAERSPN